MSTDNRYDAERVEQMLAGRELDALVAERVMGMEWSDAPNTFDYALVLGPSDPRYNTYDDLDDGRALRNVLGYSTDIAAAWAVVEAMRDVHGFACGIDMEGSKDEPYFGVLFFAYLHRTGEASADTAPLAICRAALSALAHEPLTPNSSVSL